MIKKWMFCTLLLAFLQGCMSSSKSIEQQASNASFNAKETVIKETGDNDKLISFYKESLKQGEDERVRVKLVEAICKPMTWIRHLFITVAYQIILNFRHKACT
ncbi:hypothetical protein JCM19238_1474 [Vibrio ponticus]|nr:hypothetical protein JCM19238_1474 [Vibrio ponticus]